MAEAKFIEEDFHVVFLIPFYGYYSETSVVYISTRWHPRINGYTK